MDSYKEYIQIGEHIILEMFSGDVFEGEVVNVGTNLLELVNIRQHNNPNKLQGVYTFYRAEVVRLFKLKVDASNSVSNVNSKLFRMSNIDRQEYEKLKKMASNYIYMENADSRYYKAVEDLKNAETVGVVPLGMDKSITTDIKLLGLCTSHQVYLFDMTEVNRSFYPELKRIFESKYICKVLHGGLAFVNVIFKSYNIYTTNIFDTQIADLLIEQKTAVDKLVKQTKSLADCLESYMVLPPSILKIAQERTRNQWSNRPLSATDKLYASQLCTYLFKVQHVIKTVMLENVFKTVHAINNNIRNLSDSEFEEYLSHKTVDDLLVR